MLRLIEHVTRLGLGAVAGILVLLCWGGGLPAQADSTVTIYDIRLGVHPDKMRVVLDVDRNVDVAVTEQIAPNRLILTLSSANWRVPFASGRRSLGAIASVSYSDSAAGKGQVTLALRQPLELTDRQVLPGSSGSGKRLVLDFAKVSEKQFAAVYERQESAVRAAGQLKPTVASVFPQAKPILDALAGKPDRAAVPKRAPSSAHPSWDNKYVIVLDPGHGGRDPGASGSDAIESHVVLAMAKEIRRQLDETKKFTTYLTRSTDKSLKLRQRVDFAREKKADLFMSVHADSLKNEPEVRGASIYTLDEKASDKEAAALARKENRSDILLGVDLSEHSQLVNDILITLAMRESKNASVQFARTLMPEVKKVTPLLKTNQRSAGFVVLKSPDIPSVLLELGYLSNPQDEKNLQSEEWRRRVARAIVRSIESYFGYEVADADG